MRGECVFPSDNIFKSISDLIATLFDESNISTDNLAEDIVSSLESGCTSTNLNNRLLELYSHSSGVFQSELNQLLLKYTQKLPPTISCSQNLQAVGWPKDLQVSSSALTSFLVSYDSDEMTSLSSHGYYHSKFLLPQAHCLEIINWALVRSVKLKTSNEQIIHNVPLASALGKDNVVTAWAYPEELRKSELIQSIISSDYILSVVRSYLRSNWLLLKSVNLWFSFPSQKASSESAQLFHYDQAALKWLKVFIFLSNVRPQNGPHCCVLGTHKPRSKPQQLLSRGYSRISDNDILSFFDEGQIAEFCVPRGSIVFGDTNAYHKGRQLLSGYRCVLELDFASNTIQDVIL